MSTALGPRHRAESVAQMASERFDILVVGGGVTGAGAALDAATRGLSVALIEATDYAAGASSKSSKLIHGGLRYLEMLDFALVREALTERRLLLTRLAPHLVKPVPFLWPLTHRGWERPYVGMGLLLYDTMGGRRAVPRARHLGRTGALKLAPALRPDALIGGVQFYDAQEDDARMVAVIARTAAAHGAALATNVRMDGLITSSGRVTGIRASDLLAGTTMEIGARHVVLATGAWTGRNEHPSDRTNADLRVRPSKGVHIVVPRHRIAMDTGLLTRTEKSVLFVIPWGNHWLIGDTDTEWPYDPSDPVASRADIDYLLAKVNHMLRDPLTAADIEGVFAGLRPLVAAGTGADTTKLSREHTVRSPGPGRSVIAGGKYTTYRVMARDLIDVAARDLGDLRGRPVPASRTDEVPLSGAEGYEDLQETRNEVAESAGLPVAQVERLLGRYGSDLTGLLGLIASNPALKEPVPGAGPYLGAEIVYACSHEGAVHLDDVLSRRTRVRIEVRDRGAQAAPYAAELMAGELGWDAAKTASEVTTYLDMIAVDLAAEEMPDDLSAFEAASGPAGRAGLTGSRPESPPITSIQAD
ncbi:MAG: glycerol-3-phosphate dehydrogenase/oxidase [Nocardiopsaceae bacterium]|jgi:glycerol-3-phosphate dehydrogenase|nr:glycerol-3-phosphate dehydrogenase/oxidase [Nocardiopsaceae bacterium]